MKEEIYIAIHSATPKQAFQLVAALAYRLHDLGDTHAGGKLAELASLRQGRQMPLRPNNHVERKPKLRTESR